MTVKDGAKAQIHCPQDLEERISNHVRLKRDEMV